ncbi:sugar phosphate isomerase/epimerase family protein [Novosphingobium sp.]|uniref:sugar phosphate isomerase/epimerase family protein n=1 Tax=Novosphingobium sp. TaxID=1874826 RepID=UPI002FE40552
MPHPLGIDMRTVAGMGPVEHVRLAAQMECKAVSLGLEQPAGQPEGYAPWSLRDDAALRREVRAALTDGGLRIGLGEGINGSATLAPEDHAADMDIFAELGTRRIGARDNGLEREQAFDYMARLAEMARARDMDFAFEFSPIMTVRNLAEALALVAHIGGDRVSVTVDALHFFRSGGAARQLAELDAALIGHVRLCDALLKEAAVRGDEPGSGRLIPGEGDLPLREFVDALPRGKTLGLDMTLPQAALGVEAARDYLVEVVARTRALLA